jgi:pilus assembly protein Flp/PilA
LARDWGTGMDAARGFVAWVRQVAGWTVARADVRSQRGATAVEYGIVVSLIAAVMIVSVIFLGKKTSSSFSCVASNVGAGINATEC